jgi:hypothetical protein
MSELKKMKTNTQVDEEPAGKEANVRLPLNLVVSIPPIVISACPTALGVTKRLKRAVTCSVARKD